jgi:hypothetical protein
MGKCNVWKMWRKWEVLTNVNSKSARFSFPYFKKTHHSFKTPTKIQQLNLANFKTQAPKLHHFSPSSSSKNSFSTLKAQNRTKNFDWLINMHENEFI